MIYLALSGPLVALGFLVSMEKLERWLTESIRESTGRQVVAKTSAPSSRPARQEGDVVDVRPTARRVRLHRAHRALDRPS